MNIEGRSLSEADPIETGETAPDFIRPLVTASYWQDVALSELLQDGPVLLVFYPMDGTGFAKYTWIEIRERQWGNRDYSVVGLSISTPYEHHNMLNRHRLPYGLFSDPNNDVAERYGIVRDHHGMTGIRGPRPAYFLIDSEREVLFQWVAEKWPQTPDYDAIEGAMERLL